MQKGFNDSPPASHTMHYPPVHAPNGTASAFAAAQPNGDGPPSASEDEGSPQMEPPHPASYMEVRSHVHSICASTLAAFWLVRWQMADFKSSCTSASGEVLGSVTFRVST